MTVQKIIQHLWDTHKKKILISGFMWCFGISLIYSTPIWVLNNILSKYSGQRLQLLNTYGTFWHGSGLLVAKDARLKHASSLLFVQWHITLQLHKFINIDFTTGDKKLANIYLNSTGINIDNLDLSLSLTQVSELFDVVKDLGLTGNLQLTSTHININKKLSGNVQISLHDIASSISKVNPLGSYHIKLDVSDGTLQVTSNPSSILHLSGTGSINSLTLNARISDDKKADMLQFITVMGSPQADGSYQLKLF